MRAGPFLSAHAPRVAGEDFLMARLEGGGISQFKARLHGVEDKEFLRRLSARPADGGHAPFHILRGGQAAVDLPGGPRPAHVHDRGEADEIIADPRPEIRNALAVFRHRPHERGRRRGRRV